MHYGLLPRANRGIFAINELPDLAGKIQVGLFNILQEGDVQIKGYPVRLPLDVLMAFTANPEDYTARGKIITPLKDRIGSEIRTHYPAGRADAMAITAQEAWLARNGADAATPRCRRSSPRSSRRSRSRRGRIAASTSAPASASGCRSRRWRTSCRTPSGGRWRRARRWPCPRHRRLRGAAVDHRQVRDGVRGRAQGRRDVARELIRAAVATVADGYLSHLETRQVIEWFDLGGSLQLSDTMSAADVLAHAPQVQGLRGARARGRHSDERVGAAAGVGDRLRARRPVRDRRRSAAARSAAITATEPRRCASRHAR